MKVAIIGVGYVGQAYLKVFPDALCYQPSYWDENVSTSNGLPVLSGKGLEAVNNGINVATKDQINKQCHLAIVSVPTPMQSVEQEFKPVDLSAIEEVVGWLETPLILIKSTVPPGTIDRLVKETGKKIAFSPEYVGEGKYQITPWKYMSPNDPRTHEFQIFGGEKETCDQIANIFVRRLGPEKFYYIVSAVEAEIIKYMENSWGAMKVIFANEFYQLCQKLGASYHRVREGWALDNRVERMHTSVFVDEQGFSGKCYPKDLNGIVAKADEIGVDMSMIKTVLRKNKEVRHE
jgi:UDPglucose 6-dehydrogenase